MGEAGVIYTTNPSLVRAEALHSLTRQRQEPTGSGAAWSLYEARPGCALCSARIARSLSLSLCGARVCDDRRGYVQSDAVASSWYGTPKASSQTTRRQDCGRLCERCSTRGWWWVWQYAGRCCSISTAAGGSERSEKRVFQACIRTCGGIFLGCLVRDRQQRANAALAVCSVASRLSFGPRLGDCA